MSALQPRVRHLGVALCLCLLAALASACGGRPAPVRAVIPAGFGDGAPLLATAEVVAAVPRDTWLLVAAKSPRALAEQLDWPALLAPYGDLAAQLRAGLEHSVGVGELSPEALRELGIDPAGAFGVAGFVAEQAAGALFARVHDRARLEAFLGNSLGPLLGEHTWQDQGDARVLLLSSVPLAFVIRDRLVFGLVAENPADRERLAGTLAALAPGDALAAEPEFRAAMARLDFGSDVAAYLAVHRLADRLLTRMEQNRDTVAAYIGQHVDNTQAELQRAEASGSSEDVLSRLRERLAEAQHTQREIVESFERTRRLLAELAVPLGGVGVGAVIEPGGVRVRVAARPQPGSLPARLIRPSGRPLGLLRALRETPVLALGSRGEAHTWLSLYRLAQPESGDADSAQRRLLRALTGVDIERDLVPLLDGELGLAVTAERERLLAGEGSVVSLLGLCMVAGLADAEGARALLERVAARPTMAALAVERPTGTGLAVPVWGETRLFIDIAGDYLVAATDPEAAARVLGAPAELPADALGARGSALLEAGPWDALFALDIASLAAITWADVDMAEVMLPRPENDTGPLVRELSAIDAELRALERELALARRARVQDAARRLGRLLLVARAGLAPARDGDGASLGLFGGQFVDDGSPREIVQALLELLVPELAEARGDGGEAGKRERLDELYERYRQVLEDIEAQQDEAADQAAASEEEL
ncbi:hypothetical protein [Haliangium ochraceum]|uniref:hypothetical protein n=1 Tax=Haliangium ochraceum TaxID=80816 RepID=UPI0002E1C153|nr:hypothetical protein [Haliangium ochraceum]